MTRKHLTAFETSASAPGGGRSASGFGQPSHGYKYELDQFGDPASPNGTRWKCQFPDAPNCVGIGSSPNEAVAKAERALEDWLTYAKKNKIRFAKPGESRNFSGQLRLRIGPDAHCQLASLAKVLNTTLNNVASIVLNESLETIVRGPSPEACPDMTAIPIDSGKYAFLAVPPVVESDLHSGELNLRIPKELHFRVWLYSQHQKVSMNMISNSLIFLALGRRLGMFQASLQTNTKRAVSK